jgi:exopolyphosphatase/pppGpp-phosphohydrolase
VIAPRQGRSSRAIPDLSASRVPTLAAANLLLRAGRGAEAEPAVVSSFGIREGLLYDDLDARARRAIR